MTDLIPSDAPSTTYPLYSRASVGKVFPDPITPFSATTGFLANLAPAWRDAYVATGAWDRDLYEGEGDHVALACFEGYLYINMSLMRLIGVRVPGWSPEAVDLRYLGDMPGIPSYRSERRPFDESPEHTAKAGAWLTSDVLGATDLAPLDDLRAYVRYSRANRPDWSVLGDVELVSRIVALNGFAREMFAQHVETSLKADIGLGAITRVCEAIGRPELAMELLVDVRDVDSADASLCIWELGRVVAASAELSARFASGTEGLYAGLLADRHRFGTFVDDLQVFLADWDFRGPNEWELCRPTWGTRPDIALGAIHTASRAPESESPGAEAVRRAEQRLAAEKVLREALAGNAEALGQFEAALRAAKLWLRGLERTRTTCGMTMHEQRLPALELAYRGVESGHLDTPEQFFMLCLEELDDYLADGAAFTDLLRERERAYRELFEYEPPFVVNGVVPPLSEWGRRAVAVR